MIPDVSVIVVSYNTSDLTVRALRGLRASGTTIPYEIIAVDNASADGSADAIEAAGLDATVVRLPENVGFARAVNAGAARARGQYLMLLNPDAEPVGDVIAAFMRFVLANPRHKVYAGRTLGADGADDGRSVFALPSLWGMLCFATGLSTVFRRSRLLNPDELPGLDRTVAQEVPAASGCILLVERALFQSIGGFTPDYFMYSEDVDLCAKATATGAAPILVPEARVVHVGGASSTSAGKRVMVLRGKVTYLRLRWSRPRAATGRALLATGIAIRAAGARVTGRATYWREVWAQRSTWLAGWPATDVKPDYEEAR
jgi:N-acetylglucosaminyl-diphospho-decaprenol L-rhamnosyltransferase